MKPVALEKVKDALNKFEKDLKDIQTATTMTDFNTAVKSALLDMRGVIVFSNTLIRDLNHIRETRRKEILSGEVEKVVKTAKTKTAKAKKTSK